MPCKSCGGNKPSLVQEREREQRAIKRRQEIEAGKQAFMQRRSEMVAQVREQRRQARG